MSSSVRTLFVASFVAFALTGCYANFLSRPGTLPPASAHVTAEQRSATWQRAIAVLLEQGYVPQVLNEAAGFVSAKQRDDLAPGATIGALAIVVVSPDGTVRIQVSGTGVYHSQDELDADLAKRQRDLLAAIVTPS